MLLDVPVGGGGLFEAIDASQLDAEWLSADEMVEPLEGFARRLAIVASHAHALGRVRLGLDAVWIGDARALPHRRQHLITTASGGEDERGVEPAWREATNRFGDVVLTAVDRNVGAQAANQRDA